MKVYELLDSPKKWLQGDVAQDSNGVSCGARDSQAVSWCLIGALDACRYSTGEQVRIFEHLDYRLGMCFIDWNNTRGRKWEDIIAICKELDV